MPSAQSESQTPICKTRQGSSQQTTAKAVTSGRGPNQRSLRHAAQAIARIT
jgi:hypothetical protein